MAASSFYAKNRGDLGTAMLIQNKGMVYTYGRDNRFRPIVVINVGKINELKVVKQ